MSRFDYVKYDQKAVLDQESAKDLMIEMETLINSIGTNEPARCNFSSGAGRARSLALTKLEEVYMWIGKAIRDDQITRNGSAPLQEERANS